MNSVRRVGHLALVLSLAVIAPMAVAAQPEAPAVHARRIVESLVAEKFDDVTAEFNEPMTALLPSSKLREVWTTLRQQVGAFTGIIDQRVTTPSTDVTAVVIGCRFEKAELNAIIAFDGAHKIAGLRLVPRQSAATEPSVAPAGSRFKEEEVTVGTGEWALPGTLSMPIGQVSAAVVLVHGSGPQDRDETGGPTKPFRDLAWGLADRGIAVLRYEKRSRQYGAKMAANTIRTVREEAIDDALLAVTLLRHHAGIDPRRIFVLGHSLGGTLAPRIAAADPSLAGIIVLAGATRPLLDVAREQLVYLASLAPGGLDPEQGLQMLKRSAPESYWTDLDAYKPAEVAATLHVPMFIGQGERDYQVTMADLQGWRDALGSRRDVIIKTYPTLNHRFMEGVGKATPAEYDRPGHVATFVVEDIAAWIRTAAPSADAR